MGSGTVVIGGNHHTRTVGVGSWECLSQLGEGGQGTVWLARQIEPDAIAGLTDAIRACASPIRDPDQEVRLHAALRKYLQSERPASHVLKLYKPRTSDDTSAPFARSAEELGAYESLPPHPRVVALQDSGAIDDGRTFCVFPYYAAGSLVEVRDRYVANALASLEAVQQILEAIVHLHSARFVHRDIKPDNVLVDRDGSLVVADLGLVLRPDREQSITRVNERVGNWQFGPNWFDLDPKFQRDQRVDIYATGKVLWWLASGRTLLPAESYQEPECDLTVLFPRDSGMTLVHAIVGKALAPRPERMGYASAAEMLADVQSAAEQIRTRRHAPGVRPAACFACQSGSYVAGELDRLDPLEQWRQVESSIAEVIRFRCNACGHLLWYATPHSEDAASAEQSPGSRPTSEWEELLDRDAKELLIAAAASSNGRLMRVETMSGYWLQVSGKRMFADGAPRTRAKAEASISTLLALGLIEDRGTQGDVFAVTQRGYDVADTLTG